MVELSILYKKNSPKTEAIKIKKTLKIKTILMI